MSFLHYLVCWMILHVVSSAPQINLYYTDLSGDDDHPLVHDCLHVGTSTNAANVNRELIAYCISEPSTRFRLALDSTFPQFTLAELADAGITSEQLHRWSMPIDVIERYQLYLNQLPTSDDPSAGAEVVYNCTLPRFGPACQYEFDYHHSQYSSLHDLVDDFYRTYEYKPTNFTCYIHLQCRRGFPSACLDWTEICNGQIDCLDDGADEQHCWQLEINECNADEHRCANGQCIPRAFYRDQTASGTSDCLDGSDEQRTSSETYGNCATDEPAFRCEELICSGGSLTSSCVRRRQDLLLQAMFSIKNDSVSDECWSVLKCVLRISDSIAAACVDICHDGQCAQIIARTCPAMFFTPAVPILFEQFYLAYDNADAQYLADGAYELPYVCYKKPPCEHCLNAGSHVFLHDATCHRLSDRSHYLPNAPFLKMIDYPHLYSTFWKYNQIPDASSAACRASSMYRCMNTSKCIAVHRRNDGVLDCPFDDDEDRMHVSVNSSTDELTDPAPWLDEELKEKLRYARNNISFQTICDGFVELWPIAVDGRNETDETDCQLGRCNNIYTRCNGLWNCPNGEDELDCDPSAPFHCAANRHLCVSPETNQWMCLPTERANDGRIDCLGAADEPVLCRTDYQLGLIYNFRCRDHHSSDPCISSMQLCDSEQSCDHGDDEQFCQANRTLPADYSICYSVVESFQSDIEKFLCETVDMKTKELVVHFMLNGANKSDEGLIEGGESTSLLVGMPREHQPRCHRGLDLRVWLSNERHLSTTTCLCPPSFYGDQCQFQNQRVSLTVNIQTSSDSWKTPFLIVISLIDDSDQRLVHSHEQITYLSTRDCHLKFNVYLLYSSRPKNTSVHYAVHVDVYEKLSLTYRGTLFFPLAFPFLPIHRLALRVDIPRRDRPLNRCSHHHRCMHGQCFKYLNDEHDDDDICHCEQGWSGRYCQIPHHCLCSSHSLCVGFSMLTHRSICLCPTHQFGPRCLINSICQPTNNRTTCLNHGQCIPSDDHLSAQQSFTCVCPQGFSGHFCQTPDATVVLAFDEHVHLSQSLFLHFIQVVNNAPPLRTTTFRTLPLKQDSLVIHHSLPFHLLFIEPINKDYYLVLRQHTYSQAANTPSHH